MTHLTPEEIVDIAEGARAESSTPHLSTCDACRAQVDEMRALLSAVASVDVPEPSPLYWDHLSTRVRDAVGAERPRRSWTDLWTWPGALVPAAVGFAVVVTAVMLVSRPTVPLGPAVAAVALNVETLESPDDASLNMVADLTASLDWDGASEAGLTAGGSAEHAVTHLQDGELRELARLIKEEVARSGA